VSRASGAAAKLVQPADASLTSCGSDKSTGVSMSEVRNAKRRTNGICDGRSVGWGRCVSAFRSWFVLALFAGAYFATGIGGGDNRLAIDLTTVICHEPSVSRASGAAAKLVHPADASLTSCGTAFKQA
jgi:hypothetical protein